MFTSPKDLISPRNGSSKENYCDTISDEIGIKPEFSVRIVVCDHYMSHPVPGVDVNYSEFRGTDIKQVPILRVFGPTPEGYKACAHIHGVFPYFYIPCPAPNPEPQFLYQIAASLDKALNIALKQASSTNQHVYKIMLVKGLPFYGFHDKEHLFLKIFLYNPGLIRQAVELCSNGAILGQALQPHESHLNFTLQFFIDFNLFGMSNIDLQCVKFRKNGISQCSDDPIQSCDDFGLKPESSCYYEVDCIASHIVNRQRVGRGDGVENPGLEEVWNQERERRKQLNLSMNSKSLSQGRFGVDETETHTKYDKLINMKISNVDDNNKPLVKSETITEVVNYPAETKENSQLLNATDVSHHIQDNSINISSNVTLRRSSDVSMYDDNTLVDEDAALNSSFSFQYSQILLDNDDLELVDMLQDLEEKPVEDDSIMGTPANNCEDENELDSEYSQVFNEDTILLDTDKSKEKTEETLSWNDSFWEDVNIPQLDGTCDDDHVKKVRKRKMRSFKLGLSRPKGKKKTDEVVFSNNDNSKNEDNDDDIDEINVSRETIDDISSLHLKKSVKKEPQTPVKNITNDDSKETIADLVNKLSFTNKDIQINDLTTKYDIHNKFEPQPGPSNVIAKNELSVSLSDTYESSPDESKMGIESFYDKSRFFDLSADFQVQSNYDEDFLSTKVKKEDINIKYELSYDMVPKETHKLNNIILTPKIRPPTLLHIKSSLGNLKIPNTKNPDPFFSNYKDAGDKIEIGHIVLKLSSKLAKDQKLFDKIQNVTSLEEWRHLFFLQNNEISQETKPEALKVLLAGNRTCILEPLKKPPLRSEIIKCMENNKNEAKGDKNCDDDKIVNIDELDSSQAIGLNELENTLSLESEKESSDLNNTLQVTMQPDGSYLCFGNSEGNRETTLSNPTVETDFLTLMLLEVHTSVRGDLNPDPALDQIQAVFIAITNDCPPNHFLQRNITEIYIVNELKDPKFLQRCGFNSEIIYVSTENEILEKIMGSVKKHDPDIMCGYEIEAGSWGYVLERAQVLGFEMIREMSRITEKNRQKRYKHDENEMEGRVIGRITFNVWRLFRYELALSSYSFENCMYVILNERVQKYTYAQLSEWWDDESRILRWIPVDYYLTKLNGTVRMLEKLDMINRTSELARLFGLQWWEVLSRGSQFRVESLMLRAARPLNLVALSPTVRQRAAMRAPECLPLIFEPESRFYTDPVIVLDFQSLYPSMMIAYNYCFSTCIGRIQNINGDAPYEFGAWRLRIPQTKLETLIKNGLVHWSPVGVGFIKPSVRRGVLPALLRRILAARQAVKKGMKLQNDEAVKKAMHSRQLGLKLIANVTYGYTAANFSGRMPCVEVGDSVVAKGRETLQRAIKLVQNGHWNAKVVYGDTDSMFVLVPGGTRAEAFEIGQQIADAVTADNPSPVLLKLEKVYQPCILQTKKRYVGYMYETVDQEKPVYEAKGIETVRRDGCPAGVKLLQKALCELFETGDMSRVKHNVCKILTKLADGSLSSQELLFTREYHGAAGYRPGASAPPNEIAKRALSRDRRSSPRSGERVSWLVCAGPPNTPLVRLAYSPREVMREPALSPHVSYYVTRVLLPPLHRCLSLLGVDVFKWWQEIGWNREPQIERTTTGGIARYMQRGRCAVCGAKGTRALCHNCSLKTQTSMAVISSKLARAHTHMEYCYQAFGCKHKDCQFNLNSENESISHPRSDIATKHCVEFCYSTRMSVKLNARKICKSCSGHSQYLKCENTECPVLWRRVSALHKLQQTRDTATNLPPVYMEESLL